MTSASVLVFAVTVAFATPSQETHLADWGTSTDIDELRWSALPIPRVTSPQVIKYISR